MPISPPQRLGDDFVNPIGHWENYDQYDEVDQSNLEHLKVITLRALTNNAESISEPIVNLGNDHMTDLSSMTVEDIGNANVIVHDENWIGAEAEPSAFYHYQNLLTANLTSGQNVIESVMSDRPVDINPTISRDAIFSVDSQSDTQLGDWILGDGALGGSDQPYSVVFSDLPNFPVDVVNLNTSYLELTSAPDGSFDSSFSAKVTLADNIMSNSSSDENAQLSIKVGDFENDDFDLTSITGVRYVINASGPATLKILSLYVASNTANVRSNLRLDSLRSRVYKTPHARSNLSYTANYDPYPVTIPRMWRTAGISGQGDPKPYDVEFALSFYTGSNVYGGELNFFCRENTLDPVTMVDLNAVAVSSLDGEAIPQFSSEAGFLVRTQDQLGIYTQNQLDLETQIDLSRTPDGELGNYAQFHIEWKGEDGSLSMGSAESTPYTYTLSDGLESNRNYVLYASLEGNRGRIAIYETSLAGTVGDLVFDSGSVENDNIWPRLRGRVGWHAVLNDGDAYLESIKDRKVVFGEYRSRPMRSLTPVDGVQLFAQFTPKTEHFTGFEPGSMNTESTKITREGTAWKVTSSGGVLGSQGIQSNLFELFDLDNSTIEFDFKLDDSTNVRPEDIKAFLVDQYGVSYHPIAMTLLRSGERQRVNAVVPSGFGFATGKYRLLIIQEAAVSGTWYVDDVSVSTRSITWSGRSEPNSPFDTNSSPWIPFNDMIGENKSLQFAKRGKGLQVRGQVLRQDGEISKIQIVPKYAELGRILEV